MAGIHVTLLDGSRRHGFGGDSGLYFGLLAGLSEGPWWILEEKKTISEIPALSSKISVNAGDESTLVAIPVAFDDEDLAALYDPSRGQWINDRIDLAAIHLRSNAQNADIARLLQWINVTTKSFPVIQSAISVGEMIGLLLGALDNQRRSHLLGEVALAVTSTWLAGSRAWVYSAEEYKLP